MSGQNTPSRKKLEKIAKKLVSADIQSQTNESFIIDKEVFDKFFPEIKESIKDSSLSDFILKYDLELHTTELLCVFPPDSSKKSKFNYLRCLHRDYGYHLCYMALRESANEDNENNTLVEKMKNEAIALNKNLPTELFSDSPLSSDDDIPQGQGESTEQRNDEREELSNDNQQMNKHDQLDEKLPKSANTITSKEELALHAYVKDPIDVEGTSSAKGKQHRSSVQYPIYNHMESCRCVHCLARSISDPGPDLPISETAPFDRLHSEGSVGRRIEKHSEHKVDLSLAQKSGHRPVPFVAPQEVLPTVKDTSENISGDNIDQSSTMTAAYESSVKEAARD